ncbi:MAG: tRNA 2-thiouridine(34) synthase MnmA [Cyclobacteriaceae bacterium]|nr:tRNA 2-thiouridine(34) synthase MnmA [Cyclobacteriaceae bacterium]
MTKRVVVGLSGGVDSSVAAFLLKEQGYDVIGLFMKNWHDDTVTISRDCPWLEDSNDALLVSQKLGIPFQTIDLSEPYKERIVDYMFREYEHGRTPNPDILCNREIKFDIFLDTAMALGADYIATGHYSRIEKIRQDEKDIYRLLSGVDRNKDQSYFLCQLSQYQLSKALFPVGELTKPQVREIAREIGLPTADKKDSQGLCFIGKVRLPEFLMQKLKPMKGDIIEIPEDFPAYDELPVMYRKGNVNQVSLKDLTTALEYHPEDGKKVGEHNGAHYFTIGQRKGLHVGGTPAPLFVIQTDTHRNIIYTGQGNKHPGLYRKGLFVRERDIHWIRKDLELTIGQQMNVQARIRYRQALEPAVLHHEPEGLFVIFDHPQKGVTPGQFIAWYDEKELQGSGIID